MVSVNQVRHLFVVDSYGDTTKKGGLVVKAVKENKETTGLIMQFLGEGGLLTSDLVKKDCVLKVTHTSASDMKKQLKQVVLTLDPTVNGGEPIADQDYILDVMISNYICMADESTLVKFAAAHATSTMTASQLYKELAKSLARNFSRDVNKFFKIYLTEETTNVGKVSTTWHEVTVNSDDTSVEATGIIISEQSQEKDYVVGEVGVNTVNFTVIPHTVICDGDECSPFAVGTDGVIKPVDKVAAGASDKTYIGNGYEIADTEYFTMGERGDQYRQMGYPRTIRTKYMVTPETEYDTLDINFYFVGRGVDAQKSEKLLTLVVPADTQHSGVMDSIIEGINTVLGTSYATL